MSIRAHNKVWMHEATLPSVPVQHSKPLITSSFAFLPHLKPGWSHFLIWHSADNVRWSNQHLIWSALRPSVTVGCLFDKHDHGQCLLWLVNKMSEKNMLHEYLVKQVPLTVLVMVTKRSSVWCPGMAISGRSVSLCNTDGDSLFDSWGSFIYRNKSLWNDTELVQTTGQEKRVVPCLCKWSQHCKIPCVVPSQVKFKGLCWFCLFALLQ